MLRALFTIYLPVIFSTEKVIFTSNVTYHHFGEEIAAVEVVSSINKPVLLDCASPRVHWMYNEKDSRPGVRVTVCPSSNPTAETFTSPYQIAACLPALFNVKESESKTFLSSNSSWILSFLEYYSKLGVEHFFLYFIGNYVKLETSVPHTWIDVSWVPDMKKKKGMWYFGQYWTINDCLYRNKAIGTKWVLFQDWDEIFVSSNNESLNSLLVQFNDEMIVQVNSAKFKSGIVDSIYIGNYGAYSKECSDASMLESWSSDQCIRTRSTVPECRARGKNADPYMCTTWKGRRKHLDRVRSVFLSKVHKTLACEYEINVSVTDSKQSSHSGRTEKECIMHDVSAKEFWLDHYRGAPFNLKKQCICV